ncbi:hypothetical protein H2200_007090 [Cladophialophora chaetospira]|uniref:Uncharacterized protein n=1 Tax=Cladophialophora chaetospira TaxID=386627 RepID=A0AA38X760_9EURO|nr:hypothetical protein H2200_007090 [Cladophialophora chaetospira]
MSTVPTTLPPFSALPLREGDPPRSAWGRWGDNDQKGTLNYLTAAKVQSSAQSEILTGRRVGLNLPLDLIDPPLLGRKAFEKTIVNKAPKVINDDVITFNTQSSSQWDSFRHFAYQKEGQFYGGVTQDQIHGSSGADYSDGVNGLDAWAEEAIAGRGVLVDYLAYAERNGMNYEKTKSHQITVEAVEKILQATGTKCEVGDILFLRTGFVRGYLDLDQPQREALKSERRWPGLVQSKATAEWLWEKQFAAVAADNPAFECGHISWHLHPMLLAGWGTPIGELFDLEGLAKLCKELGRYSFFVSSAPLPIQKPKEVLNLAIGLFAVAKVESVNRRTGPLDIILQASPHIYPTKHIRCPKLVGFLFIVPQDSEGVFMLPVEHDFRSLLVPIADTTIKNEPECRAYAWFTSVSDNEVPDRYMRGIEVYKHADALAVTHRGSEAYKAMRSAMIPEAITEEPTDLRPLQHTGIGFLARNKEVDDFSRPECQDQLLVVRRFSPRNVQDGKSGLKSLLRQAVERIDGTADVSARVRSFWILEYSADLNDSTVVTIERYVDELAFEDVSRQLQGLL